MNTLISLKNVNKSYKKTVALNNLSFNIKKNDFIALIGNNGCGKTTTINIICNLITYDSGKVLVFDKKVIPNYVSYKNRLGIVLDQPYFIEEFNVIEYWKFVCKFQHVPKKEVKQRINDLISLLNLQADTKKPIKNLSSGNQTKVSLGAAVIHNPEILILDEPLINLDIQTTEKFINVLKSFKGKKTLFITSHNLDLVSELCDTFLIMDEGKIAFELNKADYSSIELLKKQVKDKLIKTSDIKNISWLDL